MDSNEVLMACAVRPLPRIASRPSQPLFPPPPQIGGHLIFDAERWMLDTGWAWHGRIDYDLIECTQGLHLPRVGRRRWREGQ